MAVWPPFCASVSALRRNLSLLTVLSRAVLTAL